MTIRHMMNLTRRPPKSIRILTTIRPLSTAAATPPSPPPPTAMIYDRLAESVKQKLKKIESPDPRFVKHSSPHPTLISHTDILSAPLTRVTTLPNGLRIATESNLASKTATVSVFIDTGSRFETDVLNGTAHFLEHMTFQGTKNRTTRELQEEIEDMGGHLNAYTSRERTMYYAKVMDGDALQALDILSDILQNSKFEKKKIDRERNVILRQIKAVEGQTQEILFDHLHATAFQHSPLGRTILGPAENIKKISRADILNYLSTHYTARRMVISASGAVKHGDVVEQVKKLFTKLSTNPTTASDLVSKEPALFTGSEVRMLDDDIPLAEFVVAFEGASWTDADSIALMVMQRMLGSWNKYVGGGKHMGSALAQKVEINEIADSIKAFNTSYKDTGLFGVYAVAKPDCLSDLSYAIMYEITKLSYKVSEEDATRARNQGVY